MPKTGEHGRKSINAFKNLFARVRGKMSKTRKSPEGKGKQPATPLPGLLKLSLELRLKIYSHLFASFDATPQHGYAANRSPHRLNQLDPFIQPGSGLIFTNRQLLTELASEIIYSNSRLSFASPPQAMLFLSLTKFRLNQLSILDLRLSAYETRSIDLPNPFEPILKLLVESEAPLKSLFLRLTPSHPGRISYPVPLYMVPRYGYELEPIYDDLYTRSPRYPYVRTHSVKAIADVPTGKSWLGRLETVRCLKVIGQPEHGRDVELGLLRLYLRMEDIAREEGKKVVLGRDNGSKGHEYFFECWIQPAWDGSDHHRVPNT